MKKSLFCAVLLLMTVSLASGWCFADWFKYCSGTVSNSCSGQSLGQPPEGGEVLLPCDLNGEAMHACLYVSYYQPIFCNETTSCEGKLADTIGACYQVGGNKGCDW